MMSQPKRNKFFDYSQFEKTKNNIISGIFSIAKMSEEFKSIIDPDTKYVLEISSEIKNKLASGEYGFMQSGDKIKATLVDKSSNKIAKILDVVPTAENKMDFNRLSSSMQTMLLQEQMRVINEQLSEIMEKTELVLRGQMSDRLGIVCGAWDTYQQAIEIHNPKLKENMILCIIGDLNIGRQQMFQYLSTREDDFSKLPETKGQAMIKNFNGKLDKNATELYNNCNQSIIGIIISTVVLSQIYLAYGETAVIDRLHRPVLDIVCEYQKDFKKLMALTGEKSKLMGLAISPERMTKFLKNIEANAYKKDENIKIELTGAEIGKLL